MKENRRTNKFEAEQKRCVYNCNNLVDDEVVLFF